MVGRRWPWGVAQCHTLLLPGLGEGGTVIMHNATPSYCHVWERGPWDHAQCHTLLLSCLREGGPEIIHNNTPSYCHGCEKEALRSCTMPHPPTVMLARGGPEIMHNATPSYCHACKRGPWDHAQCHALLLSWLWEGGPEIMHNATPSNCHAWERGPWDHAQCHTLLLSCLREGALRSCIMPCPLTVMVARGGPEIMHNATPSYCHAWERGPWDHAQCHTLLLSWLREGGPGTMQVLHPPTVMFWREYTRPCKALFPPTLMNGWLPNIHARNTHITVSYCYESKHHSQSACLFSNTNVIIMILPFAHLLPI